MVAPESAVIVPVPEAEKVVGEHRATLDRTAAGGVPAHVTVLYPFLPPDRIGTPELCVLREVVRSVPRFTVAFVEVRWFGEHVVWIAPEPDTGFRTLTDAVTTAFPGCPPYGGAFGDPIPHLTVGAHADPQLLRAAGTIVAMRLPFAASIDAVHVIRGSTTQGGWTTFVELPLG